MKLDNLQSKRFLLIFFGTVGLTCLGLTALLVSNAWFKAPEKKATNPGPPITDLMQRHDYIVRGEYQFKVRCVSCHGMNGQGSGLAPALNDKDAIYGNDIKQILHIITNGTPNLKMLGWGKKLKEDDLKALAVYVKSLQEDVKD